MDSKEINLAKTFIDLYALFLESDRPEPHETATLEEFIVFLTDKTHEPAH